MNPIETIRQPSRAATLLAHPLRTRILALARDPISAAELARRLDLPRQRTNYHVRQLVDAGFLQAAGQQQKRNMVEQQYIASARSYVLTPDVLGEAAPTVDHTQDGTSAAHLLSACAQAQSEVAQLIQSAHVAGVRARTTSLWSDVGFTSHEHRAAFTADLLDAINDVIARHSAFVENAASVSHSRKFRLIAGCYPVITQ